MHKKFEAEIQNFGSDICRESYSDSNKTNQSPLASKL